MTSNHDTLDKSINHFPLRCRVGWHDWKTERIVPGVIDQNLAYLYQRCERCPETRVHVTAIERRL